MNEHSVGGIIVMDKISRITVPTPFEVGDVHIYVLAGEALSLIDAGAKTKASWEAFTSQLKEIGYHPNDIEQIILTHHHPDHIGLIEQFSNAEKIVAHPNVNNWLTLDEQYVEHYLHFFQEYFKACSIPEVFYPALEQLKATLQYVGKGELTDMLTEGDALPGHPDWKVIDTKGHAQSHLSFFREQDQVLIGGDHVLKHISSNPIVEPPELGRPMKDRPKPLLQYRENLKKCADLGIKKILSSHGEAVNNPGQLIFNRLKKQEERADFVYQLLIKHGGKRTPFEICAELFPKQYKQQISLTMSETIGQLDYLESKQLVIKSMVDGKLFYEAADIDR
jgi:glyoxylase-like metal-dependent hydrolase (beta-lactamase superfamily II)